MRQVWLRRGGADHTARMKAGPIGRDGGRKAGAPIRKLLLAGRALAAALAFAAGAGPAAAQSVLTYHGNPERSGAFVETSLSWERARTLRLEPGFAGRFDGHVYAQPLYWYAGAGAPGRLIVATENDTVVALDAASGRTIWTRSLGAPVPRSSLPCGNIGPLGITGTPAIDTASGAVYLDAMVLLDGIPRHRLFALSLADGGIMAGWPVDVGQSLKLAGQDFIDRDQNQRGALLVQNGMLYVPYGGHFGDCGTYHGWVVGVPLADPHRVVFWHSRADGGGIWAPGGVVGDGRFLYVSTGNTFGAQEWSDGEAIFRLAPGAQGELVAEDYFAPADWRELDERDADLGGSNPLPFDLPGGGGPHRLILALGKDARAYLLDRDKLGGIGGSLVAKTVARYPIRTAPAAYSLPDGERIAFQGAGSDCPAAQRAGGLTVLKIGPGSPPVLTTAWCAGLRGAGSPIVTTTDGRSDPIVWILGAEGDNRLRGFRGDTGEPLAVSDQVSGLRHFGTLIAADRKLYVGADDRLYAFTFGP